MEQEFTSREVSKLTGITARQLQWWDERGIIVPAREGHRRIYRLDDLAEVAVICELRRRAISLQRVRKLMRALQKEFGKRLVETVTAGSDYHLLTDGTRIFVETSAHQILDILKNSRQPMLALCLSDTVRQVRAEISHRAVSSLPAQPRVLPINRPGKPTAGGLRAPETSMRKPEKRVLARRASLAQTR